MNSKDDEEELLVEDDSEDADPKVIDIEVHEIPTVSYTHLTLPTKA